MKSENREFFSSLSAHPNLVLHALAEALRDVSPAVRHCRERQRHGVAPLDLWNPKSKMRPRANREKEEEE